MRLSPSKIKAMEQIYFDNSATTPLCNAAKARMCEVMEHYGNPSSLHAMGETAHTILLLLTALVAERTGLLAATLTLGISTLELLLATASLLTL